MPYDGWFRFLGQWKIYTFKSSYNEKAFQINTLYSVNFEGVSNSIAAPSQKCVAYDSTR